MNDPHSFAFCQPCRPVPASGSALDDALLEIRSRLGYAPQRLYETNGRPIRFGRGKSVPGWAFVHCVNGTWVVVYGDWRTGEQHRWTSHGQHGLTDVERRRLDQRLDEDIRRFLEQERRKQENQQAAVARSVQAQWEALPPAPADHPYLASKGVQPHGIRARADVLLVPLRDAEWKIWNLQLIQPDGGKRFLKGGRVSGLFHPFGTREDFERGKVILVCEGWATGATLHEATGLPVAAAMNCGNLLPAARALREKFPGQKLVICADDDWKTPGNPGVTKAEKAACSVGAAVVVPLWSGKRNEKDSDFNDLARVEGLDAVRRQVDAGSVLSQPVRPGLDERPCYWLLEEPAVIGEQEYKAGVYHCGIKYEKQFEKVVPVPTETWLSSPIRLKARTIEWPDGAQGVRLDVQSGNVWREVVLLREALASPRDYRKILLSKGAILETHSKDARAWLEEYLQQSSTRWEYTTKRTGWHGKQYVLPDVTVGTGETILFTGARATNEPLMSGELADWQKSVAALAVGNPLLALSISLAFAGPLLKPTGHNAVLVQLVGRSTTGKTTCLLAANSVVGPPALVTTWRATDNGLEQQALVHCDGFLALDEIGQVSAKVLDDAVYTLANGTAKQRAKAYEYGVGAVPAQRWRVAALSTGEKTIETLLAMDKRNVNAGQAVRFIEIPAEERHGAFTELHGCESGAAFADTLRRATSQYYGTPIRAFLEQLSGDNKDTLSQVLKRCTASLLEAVNNSDAAPGAQASRVLTSIALVAAAGELATHYGVTGWEQGEALEAALHCYRLWARRRAAGTDFETTSLIRQVYDFITRHSDSRFSPIGGDIPSGEAGRVRVSNPVVHDRAGYYRDRNGDREYLFTHDGFREATRGFDFQYAWQELLRLGALIRGRDHASQSVRVGHGQARVRVYVVSFSALNRALEQIEGG